MRSDSKQPVTVVLDVRPMLRGSEKAVVEARLLRLPGVLEVEANPVAQTANVTYDPATTSLAELRRWLGECGLHCAGQSVPCHLCDPLEEPDAGTAVAAPHHEAATHSPEEMMGHGGHGAMSMDEMVADMRNRFLVAALFSIPIVLCYGMPAWPTVLDARSESRCPPGLNRHAAAGRVQTSGAVVENDMRSR